MPTDPTKLAPTTAEERARWQELLAWVDNADIIGRLLADIDRLEAVRVAAQRLIEGYSNPRELAAMDNGPQLWAALRQALRDCDRCKE